MVSSLRSSIVQLSQIADSIKHRKELSYSDYEMIQDRIVDRLDDLENVALKGFSPLTETLKGDAIQVLSTLKTQLEAKNLPDKAIKKIASRILEVQSEIDRASVSEGIPEKPKIDVKFAFFSDVEAGDSNSSIIQRMRYIIKELLPILWKRGFIC